jgi:hypothetical protein
MVSKGPNFIRWHFVLAFVITIFFTSKFSFAKQSKLMGLKMNMIDRCWRPNPEWRKHRQQLATCSVGYAGKMTNNIGKGLIHYKVTDPNDDPINPQPGTLRYGASVIQGKVWITFKKDMNIKLMKPLLISSFTTIDGRGFNVHIGDNACLMIFKVITKYNKLSFTRKLLGKKYNLWREKEETSINLVMYLERNFIFFLSKFNLLTIAICSMNSISLICNNFVGHQHNHS